MYACHISHPSNTCTLGSERRKRYKRLPATRLVVCHRFQPCMLANATCAEDAESVKTSVPTSAPTTVPTPAPAAAAPAPAPAAAAPAPAPGPNPAAPSTSTTTGSGAPLAPAAQAPVTAKYRYVHFLCPSTPSSCMDFSIDLVVLAHVSSPWRCKTAESVRHDQCFSFTIRDTARRWLHLVQDVLYQIASNLSNCYVTHAVVCCRHQHYQMQNKVTVDVYAKGLQKDQVRYCIKLEEGPVGTLLTD